MLARNLQNLESMGQGYCASFFFKLEFHPYFGFLTFGHFMGGSFTLADQHNQRTLLSGSPHPLIIDINQNQYKSACVDTSDLSGKYIGYGYDPFVNQDYQMEVLVTKTQDTYQFETVDETNGEKYIGTGVSDPKDPSNLAVVYKYPNGQDVTVGQYKVQPDGSFKVTWAMLGENHTATETLQKITPQQNDSTIIANEHNAQSAKEIDVLKLEDIFSKHAPLQSDLSGKYIGYGYDPFVNQDYQMEVLVTKTQDTYQFETVDETNGEKYIGTGVSDPKDPSNLAVVYKYPNGQDVTVGQYKVQPDGSFKVTWAMLGENHTATETLQKITPQQNDSTIIANEHNAQSAKEIDVLKLGDIFSKHTLPQGDLLPDVIQSQMHEPTPAFLPHLQEIMPSLVTEA